jgi:hypothetical protein
VVALGAVPFLATILLVSSDLRLILFGAGPLLGTALLLFNDVRAILGLVLWVVWGWAVYSWAKPGSSEERRDVIRGILTGYFILLWALFGLAVAANISSITSVNISGSLEHRLWSSSCPDPALAGWVPSCGPRESAGP